MNVKPDKEHLANHISQAVADYLKKLPTDKTVNEINVQVSQDGDKLLVDISLPAHLIPAYLVKAHKFGECMMWEKGCTFEVVNSVGRYKIASRHSWLTVNFHASHIDVEWYNAPRDVNSEDWEEEAGQKAYRLSNDVTLNEVVSFVADERMLIIRAMEIDAAVLEIFERKNAPWNNHWRV